MRSPVLAAAMFVLLSAALAAAADAVRVTVDGALVWNRPSGVSVIVTQLSRGETVEVVRKVDDWYEVVLPGRERRTGFVRTSQVDFVAGGALAPPPGRAPQPARRTARPAAPKLARTFVTLDGGYRAGVRSLTLSTPAFQSRFAEPGSIDADYGKGSGFVVDLIGSYRLNSHVGFAIGGSSFTQGGSVMVAAHIPHPFYFDQFRDASFEDSGPKVREAALHVSLTLTQPLGASAEISLFAGPSFFKVTQDIVTDLTLADVYPYDEVAIKGLITEERTSHPVGFHVGADVTRFFSPNAGLGVSVRFTRAKLSFEDIDVSGVAGGPQVSAGIRFRF